MNGVLALARKRLALSHGTVPSAIPVGQTPDDGADRTLGTNGTVGTGGTSEGEAIDADAIEERAALAADRVPAGYLDAWACLQCQRPFSVDLDAWRRAIDDAGLFLDGWGAHAAAMQWSAGEVFDVPRAGRTGGLVWQLMGDCVKALGADRVRLSDGRLIEIQRFRGVRK